MVDAEVKPSLPGDLPLPVAAGVIVDQLLFFRHSEKLPELGANLLELVRVVIVFNVLVLAVLRYNPLEQSPKGTASDNKLECWKKREN